MPTAKKSNRERQPTSDDDHISSPKREIPTNVIDTDPFFTAPSTGMTRMSLPIFNVHQFLRRRSSPGMLADPEPVDHAPGGASPRPSTPTPNRRPLTPLPRSSPSSSDREVWKTPESHRTFTKIRMVELETSPASSRSRRSVDTEGDVRMLNAAFTSPEIARFQQREEIRAMVMQSVHDNFEFERARFADEVRHQLLATIGDEVEWLVRERVDRALLAAVGEPEESELDTVRSVRQRLRQMSDEALVKVFCTEEMLVVLKRLAVAVDLELKTEEWTLVDVEDDWPEGI